MKKIYSDEIYVQNKFVDDVLNNPEFFTYDQIMFISNHTVYDHVLYDYIVLNYPFIEGAKAFKEDLKLMMKYDNYFHSIMEDGDLFLKASFAFYIEEEVRDEVIGDEEEFIDLIRIDDIYPFEYKVGLLTALAIYKNHGKIIEIIKNNIVNIMTTDDRLLNIYSKEAREYMLEKYLNVIDENTESDIKKLNNKM